MTDNQMTELLCKLLEKRGIKWKDGDVAYEIEWSTPDGRHCSAMYWKPTFSVLISGCTPEQAITATLGDEYKRGYEDGLRANTKAAFAAAKQAMAATLGDKTKLNELLDEFENECFMLRVEASETRARDDAVRKSYEHLRNEFTERITVTLGNEINGDTSDGYHTFNELYHHRAILFSVIVRDHRDKAWKARKHHDGTMYDGMFIVGIETPKGQATYHYDIDPYWEMFDCEEREFAPEWDGHTPDDAIERISKLATLESSTLTAEQVREVLLYHLPHREYYSVEQTDAWQTIADELNAQAERTCKLVIKDNMDESEGMGDVWIECSACHYVFDYYTDNWLMNENYCPHCGARILPT